ncbi:hypothetical protein OG921_00865 [Aldersonia sp. NBC_00410]|jgi:hypothetical protein|uniref:hypothetical protein n=1 Tax=Aldersonia sp. NBC_00410 TaxID=2975954 RepID=UPI00225949E1|nr:hypothetical protein [Aldersonia sp. NBC_00410]MCX5041741.1 hypothetical protein [Aldersonia sp. NBC_00410]
MQTISNTLDSLWQVLAVGVAFGAGVPLMFACGLRFLSAHGDDVDADGTAKRNVRTTIAAGACFAVVLITVITGILFIMKDFLANDLGIHIF